MSATNEAHEQVANIRNDRMQPLATLPVFFKLTGKRAIVAGGSEAALWKAELLAAAGAGVDVYADAFVHEFEALALNPPAGTINLVRRSWKPADVGGAAIAIGACEDESDAAAFAAAARAAGVPVNVIDRPAFCDFQFAAIVNRSPLVVAISTDGAAPVLAQSIRSTIEALLPDGLKRWVEAAKTWRRRGAELAATPGARRRFWNRFADLAIREAHRLPDDDDLASLLREPDGGSISVAIIEVGASAESLTLGALRFLRNADVIVYNAEISLTVFDFARREARRLLVTDDSATSPIIIEAAQRGERVVQLITARSDDTADRPGSLGRTLERAGLIPEILRSSQPRPGNVR